MSAPARKTVARVVVICRQHRGYLVAVEPRPRFADFDRRFDELAWAQMHAARVASAHGWRLIDKTEGAA